MLSRLAKVVTLLSVLTAGVETARAFSLIGPLATWQTQTLGYDPQLIGGPMNLGEGYRWNLPQITYGCDPAFVTYFGSNGVAAVDQAFKILNDLPAASQLDINQYPLSSSRINYRASALMLLDVKSMVLTMMLNHMGLDSPESYAWTLRNQWVDAASNPNNFIVVRRNFDPETWEPSSYVNGVLYTYSIRHYLTPSEYWMGMPFPVDPLAANYSTVATGALDYGVFYTGLTRDDVGGIKYLYSSKRLVIENLVGNATAPSGAVTIGTGGAGWFVVDTNSQSVGISGYGSGGGDGAWWSISVTNAATSTNTTGTTTGTGTTSGTGTTTNAFVSTALRAGVDKLQFIRVNFDAQVGQFTAMTNQYVDSFFTNGVRVSQVVERTFTTAPDVLIEAADMGMDTDNTPIIARSSLCTVWQNNGTLNNLSGLTVDGPGVIQDAAQPYVWFRFSKLGPWYYNGPGFLTEGNAQVGYNGFYLWGSFDGSTNEPVAYPSGTSLKALEAQLFGY